MLGIFFLLVVLHESGFRFISESDEVIRSDLGQLLDAILFDQAVGQVLAGDLVELREDLPGLQAERLRFVF